MAIYFLNANGSNTAPYDTPAKGATDYWATIRPLLIGGDGEIVEVVDDGELSWGVNSDADNSPNLTIRSYGLPDGGGKSATDRDRWIHKPTLKVVGPGNGSGIAVRSTCDMGNRIQNINAYLDASEFNSGNVPELFDIKYGIIEGCVGWILNHTTGDGVKDNSFYCYDYSIIRNCISIDSYWGMNISNSGGETARFYNNTIVMPDMDGEAGDPSLGIWVEHVSGFAALNNIVYGRNVSRPNQIGIQAGDVGVHTQNYNNVYNVSTLYDNTTKGANSLEVDPLFADLSARNVRIRRNSRCRNAGANRTVDSNIPTTDIANVARPQNTHFDMGAYELKNGTVSGVAMKGNLLFGISV